MALCEDESSGLARVTSDDRIVRRFVARRQEIAAAQKRDSGFRNSASNCLDNVAPR